MVVMVSVVTVHCASITVCPGFSLSLWWPFCVLCHGGDDVRRSCSLYVRRYLFRLFSVTVVWCLSAFLVMMVMMFVVVVHYMSITSYNNNEYLYSALSLVSS